MIISMNNSCDPIYTVAYDELIKEVFNFSFQPWVERRLWDERYESYSFIKNGKMLSNVSIYKTDMLINCQPVRAHQFGAVATRADERGKGLSRQLMEYVLEKYPNIPVFLGANQNVTNFYPLFGFKPVQTFRPIIDIEINNPTREWIKCHPDDDVIQKALYRETVYSDILDSINTQPVKFCQMLTNPRFKNNIWFSPSHELVVVARQEKQSLFISDVISQKPIRFESLAQGLPFTGVKHVEFEFNPDWMGVNPEWKPLDEPYFIKGNWNLPEHFRFPALSET